MNPSPRFDFSGHTALVTGSTQNLGFTIAGAFAAAGASVIVHGPDEASTHAAAEDLAARNPTASISPVSFDLGNADSIARGFGELTGRGLRPDVLVNNAAHLGLGAAGFLEQSPEFFRGVFEVNLFGVFHCCRHAAPHMAASGGGAIVNISSLAGERAIWGRSAYNASKAAVDGLTRSMALELAPLGIRVNAISPGYVWTPRWNEIGEETEKRRRMNTAAGAPTMQEEIASAVLFLASDACPTLLGSNLVIDGGLSAQQVPRDTGI